MHIDMIYSCPSESCIRCITRRYSSLGTTLADGTEEEKVIKYEAEDAAKKKGDAKVFGFLCGKMTLVSLTLLIGFELAILLLCLERPTQ